MSKIVRKYNARPGVPDKAALRYRPLTFFEQYLLPKQVDLRPQCSPVFNQGNIGSCTGNAIAGALEFLQLKDLKSDQASIEAFDKAFEALSRLFIYYNERAIDGDVTTDGGAALSTGIKAINRWGICKESSWPYLESNLFLVPSNGCYIEASAHRGITALAIDNRELRSMKACLASGYPFVLGISIWSSFERAAVAETGQVPVPNIKCEEAMGGHAVLAVGYDDSLKCLIVRNSWGADWGDKGYFYLPYDYVTDPQLAWDLWIIRK